MKKLRSIIEDFFIITLAAVVGFLICYKFHNRGGPKVEIHEPEKIFIKTVEGKKLNLADFLSQRDRTMIIFVSADICPSLTTKSFQEALNLAKAVYTDHNHMQETAVGANSLKILIFPDEELQMPVLTFLKNFP